MHSCSGMFHRLHVHPDALPAFDILSSLGYLCGSVGRAVNGPDNTLLVFSGFGVFASPQAERRVYVEKELSQTIICRAAWQDVADALRLLRSPLSNRREFANALAQKIPTGGLMGPHLPPNIDKTKLLRDIFADRNDSDECRQPTIFQAALKQNKGRGK